MKNDVLGNRRSVHLSYGASECCKPPETAESRISGAMAAQPAGTADEGIPQTEDDAKRNGRLADPFGRARPRKPFPWERTDGGIQPRFVIYGLLDPRCGLIRYIGRTFAGSQRIRQHCIGTSSSVRLNLWLGELRAAGAQPVFVVLQATRSWGGARRAERKWIDFARATGWAVLNGRRGDKTGNTAPRPIIARWQRMRGFPDWACPQTAACHESRKAERRPSVSAEISNHNPEVSP